MQPNHVLLDKLRKIIEDRIHCEGLIIHQKQRGINDYIKLFRDEKDLIHQVPKDYKLKEIIETVVWTGEQRALNDRKARLGRHPERGTSPPEGGAPSQFEMELMQRNQLRAQASKNYKTNLKNKSWRKKAMPLTKSELQQRSALDKIEREISNFKFDLCHDPNEFFPIVQGFVERLKSVSFISSYAMACKIDGLLKTIIHNLDSRFNRLNSRFGKEFSDRNKINNLIEEILWYRNNILMDFLD